MPQKVSDISPRTESYAVGDLLEVFQPQVVTQRFAQTDIQPKRSSTQRKWRRYLPFPIVKAPLADGVTPDSYKLKFEDVTAVLHQYGGVVTITDVIEDVVDDPIMKVVSRLLAEQAAQTIEQLTIDILKSGSNVVYSGGVTSRSAVNSPISRGDLRIAVRGLDRAGAKPITSIMEAGADVSTVGIEPSYYAMAHTDLESDIRDIVGFKSIVEYSNPGQASDQEIGGVERIRFILTQNFNAWEKTGASGTTYLSETITPTESSAADVYPVIIVGRDAYAAVRLQGRKAFSLMVLNPGKARGGDPLGQRGTAGWKTWYAAAIVTEGYMVRIETVCTAEPQ